MTTLRLKGTVVAGKSEGAKFIQLPWAKKQVTGMLGFVPFPGTLNVKLAPESFSAMKILKRSKGMEILPVDGFSKGKCFKASLMGYASCAAVIPDVEDYAEDMVEIIAPVSLREKLHLKDGSEVEIKVTL